MEQQTQQSTFENKTFGGPRPRVMATDAFITKNNFTLNRTQDEIMNRIKQGGKGAFDFGSSVLIDYLVFENAITLVEGEYKDKLLSGDEKFQQITDRREAAQDFLDYFVFGLGKALDRRGISASRTVIKLAAWLWLLGREDLVRTITDDRYYNPYGMPALIKVGEDLGIEIPQECYDFVKES